MTVTKARLEEIEKLLNGTHPPPIQPEQVEHIAKMSFEDARLFSQSREIIQELVNHIYNHCDPYHPAGHKDAPVPTDEVRAWVNGMAQPDPEEEDDGRST